MSVKRVEIFAVTLGAHSVRAAGSQQPCVVGRHRTHGTPHARVSMPGSDALLSGLAHHQARLCSLLVLCLPAVLGHGQASVPLLGISRVTFNCRWGLCLNACTRLAPIKNPLTWTSVTLEELPRDSSNTLSFM